MPKDIFNTIKILEDNELYEITGGRWGWVSWVEPVGEFIKGFIKDVQKEGNRNKWKNV